MLPFTEDVETINQWREEFKSYHPSNPNIEEETDYEYLGQNIEIDAIAFTHKVMKVLLQVPTFIPKIILDEVLDRVEVISLPNLVSAFPKSIPPKMVIRLSNDMITDNKNPDQNFDFYATKATLKTEEKLCSIVLEDANEKTGLMIGSLDEEGSSRLEKFYHYLGDKKFRLDNALQLKYNKIEGNIFSIQIDMIHSPTVLPLWQMNVFGFYASEKNVSPIDAFVQDYKPAVLRHKE